MTFDPLPTFARSPVDQLNPQSTAVAPGDCSMTSLRPLQPIRPTVSYVRCSALTSQRASSAGDKKAQFFGGPLERRVARHFVLFT